MIPDKNRLIRFVVACVAAVPAHAGIIVFTSGAGANPAAIQGSVDAFRVFIGGGNVAGANGSFGGVRREINWDGVPDLFSQPNNLPPGFFNSNSPRGVVFSTAGTGFLTSADASNPTSTPTLFSDLNASYAGVFQTFSAERLFGVTGSNEMDVNFFVPGTATPATVSAFGAVFVDNTFSTVPNCALLEAFNGNTSLGSFCAPVTTSGGLSFLGLATTGQDTITRIRIHLGTGTLGTTQASTNEIVVMDDFIFSEPRNPVPEPATSALTLAGLASAALLARRRHG